jgi:hypothetical protein
LFGRLGCLGCLVVWSASFCFLIIFLLSPMFFSLPNVISTQTN